MACDAPSCVATVAFLVVYRLPTVPPSATSRKRSPLEPLGTGTKDVHMQGTARVRLIHSYALVEFVALANARRLPRVATLTSARLPRASPSGKKGSGSPRRLPTPGASCLPITGSVYCFSAEVTCARHSLGPSALWASVRKRIS